MHCFPLLADIEKAESATSASETNAYENSSEEKFWIKQIVDFAKENNYEIAKSQSEKFLKKFPNSENKETIFFIMAELEANKNNFPQAIKYYNKITTAKLVGESQCNKLYCMYKLELYEDIIKQSRAEDSPSKKYYVALSLHQMVKKGKKEYLKPALYLADSISDSSLKIQGKILAADINITAGNVEKAKELLHKIDSKSCNLDQQLKIAHLEIKADPKKASSKLKSLATGEKSTSKTVLLYLQSLFAKEEYDKFIKVSKKFRYKIDSKELSHLEYLLAQAHYFKRDLKKANEQIKRVIKKENPLEKALLLAVEIKLSLGKEQKALSILKKIKGDSNLLKAQRYLIQFYMKKQLFEEAGEHSSQALKISPNDKTLLHNAILIQLKLHNHVLAKQYLSRYLDGNKNPNPEIYDLLPELINKSSKNNDELIKSLKTIISEKNLSEKAFHRAILMLANAFVKEKEFDKAIDILQKHPKESDNLNCLKILSKCYYEKQQWECATYYLEKIRKKYSNENDILYMLFNTLSKQKEKLKAALCILDIVSTNQKVSKDNFNWAIDFAFQKASKNQISKKGKAKLIKILSLYAKDDLKRNWQWIHLLNNSGHAEKALEKISTLKDLHKNTWGEKIVLEKSFSYYLKNDYQKVVDILNPIIEKQPVIDTSLIARAYFKFCRSILQLPQNDQRKFQDILIISLKHLILQKTFSFEPIHLQSALMYADYLYPVPSEHKKKLLEELKTSFLENKDLLSKNYQIEKLSNEKLFKDYMVFFDAKILECEKGDPDEILSLIDTIKEKSLIPFIKCLR